MELIERIDSLFIMLFFMFSILTILGTVIKLLLPKRNKPIEHDSSYNHYAVLIPARNESRVINGLLKSIEEQTYNVLMKDVYVIVEDINDPTVAIAKSYGANVFVRVDLTKKRKGYALDEAVQYILNRGLSYDAYFIFDADNVLDKDYFYQMNQTFNDGYDAALGYRNSKNLNENVIATCSSLTFSMINTYANKQKVNDSINATISGTGFYVKGSIIESLGGYPFHTLTEDYELTLFLVLNNYSCTYNENAIYYDEQPTSNHTSFVQRVRWIKGFMQARKIYIKEIVKDLIGFNVHNKRSKYQYLVGVFPQIILILIVGGYFGLNLLLSVNLFASGDPAYWSALLRVVTIVGLAYLGMVIFSSILVFFERKKMPFTFKAAAKAILFNPIFLLGYVPAAIKAMFTKELEWKPIEHKTEEVYVGNKNDQK